MSGVERFHLPDVGEGIAEAELIEWAVAVGDVVAEEQTLVLIETDKSQVELPSPAAGTVSALHGTPGDRIEVGALLVEITVEGSPAAPPTSHGTPEAQQPAPAAVPAAELTSSVRVQRNGGTGTPSVLASPHTRKVAAALGIALEDVIGTGARGRVQLADLEAHAASSDAGRARHDTGRRHDASVDGSDVASWTMLPTAPDVVAPLRGVRRRIAQSMTESAAIPQILEFKEIDATRLLQTHRSLKTELEREGVRFSVLPLLMCATVRALRRHRNINATYDPASETITHHGAVHLGMATATAEGLLVPVLRHAESLTPRGFAEAIEGAAQRARSRTAQPRELAGGSFTVTNFGAFGTWLGTPMIRPPEVGIAGFGRIEEKVIAVKGKPKVRPVLPIAVAVDHRFNDGAHLGDFVTDLAAALSEPGLLLG